MSSIIKKYDFNDIGIEELKNISYGKNWPIVYILNGNKEAYIGETTSAYQRMKQHKSNLVRKSLNSMHIVYDSEFNKSAILDIESLLINYMSADQKYKLQNISSGISAESNYYNRDNYLNKFDRIWKNLVKQGLANHERIFLENTDLFKFSPYKNLNNDQYTTAIDIIKLLVDKKMVSEKATFIVNGNPGTGKSVLAVYLMKLLIESQNMVNDISLQEDNIDFLYLLRLVTQYNGDLKVGLVIPMESLRKTLKRVFGRIEGLRANMVIGPSEVIKQHYDILIVDEAHRLRRRVNLQPGLYATFDKVNKQLGIADGDELDWVRACSDYQILFYDKNQSIKPSDVRREKFEEVINTVGTIQFTLASQMRVKGGDYYITAIYDLLSQKIRKPIVVDKYDLRIFENVDNMYNEIKKREKEFSLCRMVAGYAWPWKTKKDTYDSIKKNSKFDIEIDQYKYVWNHTNKDWVNSLNSINEIGCIHTVQGYDLNYVGVIIGPELKYDRNSQEIIIDETSYYDMNGKKTIKTHDELFNYIINIYKVLLTRGILGTYIYICDNALREYFKRYIS